MSTDPPNRPGDPDERDAPGERPPEAGAPASGGEPEGADSAPPRCEVCGSALDADQTYCLECGSPTPLAPPLRRGGRGRALLAGALVVLGLGAGALAYAVASDDDRTTTSPGAILPGPLPPDTGLTAPLPPSTGPLPPDTTLTLPTAPTTPGFPTVTGGATTAPPAVPPPSPPAPDPAPAPDLDTGGSDWPAGRTAWTAILASVRSESDARAAAARLRAGGEPAGVLASDDFAELRPGYWVVYSGMYDDREAAIAQARSLRPRFSGAYARRLEG